MEEEIITQLGLILGQLRFTRRAVEDIERSTARYGGFSFAAPLAAGPRFGEPPMVGGALKVYVVNINDLAPGSGIGGFLEGLLGGIGRFFGGFLGGIVGGTLGGVALPFMIAQLSALAGRIERILTMLGIGTEASPGPPEGGSAAPAPAAPAPAPAPATASVGGLNLTATLHEVRRVTDAFTALFQAASTGPEAAARTSTFASTPAGERWLAMLTAAQGALAGIARVVDGLVLLVPILIGALSFVITRLDDIKLAFLETLQFILRNVLVLRGVVLTTLFDTVAAAARLAGTVLGILATTVERILGSVFTMIGSLLQLALNAIQFVGDGLQRTIDGLLRWLVDTAFTVLTRLGDTLVFRFVVHVVQLLPEIIPPIWELRFGRTFTGTITSRPIPAPVYPGGAPPPLPPFPSVSSTIATGAVIFSASVMSAASTLTVEMRNIFGTSGGALVDLSQSLEVAAAREARAAERLGDHYRTIRDRSADVASALTPAVEAARTGPATGFEAIARAYETWLGTGGLDTLLGTITQHFSRGPTTGAQAATSIPGAVVGGAVTDRPRATIEIESVIIEIAPPPAGAAAAATSSPEAGAATGALPPTSGAPEITVAALTELFHDFEERGGWNLGLGPAVMQVP
jgi:hypothetical protein